MQISFIFLYLGDSTITAFPLSDMFHEEERLGDG